ncbi:hypothetical protein F2Q70_00005855, partial [Brassica cretica]
RFESIMRATQGALIVASTLQMILGFSGLWRNVVSCSTGGSGTSLVSQGICLVIKLGENVFDRFAVVIVWIYAHLFTVGGAYNGAAPTTQTSCRTDRAGIVGAAPWIRVPCPFRWGAPSFDAGEAFAMPMMMASFFLLLLLSQPVVLFAVSRYASATMLPPSVLSRGVGWQGVAILISGLFGTGAGSSVSM